MSMNLKLVVYNVDGNEFLVDAKQEKQAINKTIKANLNEDIMGKLDEEEINKILNPLNYTVYNAGNSWRLFEDIFKRNAYATTINDVIVLYA